MPAYLNPDDPSAVVYPGAFGGLQARRIQALADYVMTLTEAEAGPEASRKQ